MKKILGLDLGTTSIGWAYIKENGKKSEIVRLGVRVNPLTTDETKNFGEGKSITTTAARTEKRQARRNRNRYKQRRKKLIDLLLKHKWISKETLLAETGKNRLHDTYRLRSEAVTQKIPLDALARVLLMINKTRGYKSSRKAVNQEEGGRLIDEMDIAMQLQNDNITPGQYVLQLLEKGHKKLPSFYKSDLEKEFDQIWELHAQEYPDILTPPFRKQIKGKARNTTVRTFYAKYGIDTIQNTSKNKKIQAYKWRAEAATSISSMDIVSFALAEVNDLISKSSDYLGAISDRSKVLLMEKLTVGQYQYQQLLKNKHHTLKNQIFYRKDYQDEFDKIWAYQSKHYKLSDTLKKEIKDHIIFYQRPLKSQKGLISFCEFEQNKKEVIYNGKKTSKTIGSKVAPRSSPLFQEFKIWQTLQNLKFKNTKGEVFTLGMDDKQLLFNTLNYHESISDTKVLKLIWGKNSSDYEMNFEKIDGNKTNAALFSAYGKMVELADYNNKYKNATPKKKKEILRSFFDVHKIDKRILDFDPLMQKHALVRQKSYQLWHLLYSYEGDSTRSGIESLYKSLKENFGFDRHFATFLINIPLLADYGRLSSKAIRKIYPYITEHKYAEACRLAGYNHSSFLTKEENSSRKLKKKLEILPKNALRNPVVEKILNQMIHVVNAILEHPDMGPPDEIRIELARELKNNAKERARINKAIADTTRLHEKYRNEIREKFGVKNPTRNDIIKYKLYKELEHNGHRTLYTNTYIKPSMLYSANKEVDIEHIIPKALSFDDSYSNKTLSTRSFNESKNKETAIDYITNNYSEEEVEAYKVRVRTAYKDGHISKSKYDKLLRPQSELKDGFIARDIRETQYISREASKILKAICRNVSATSGKITARLREDWNLTNVLKELTLPKYEALGLTYQEERKHGVKITKLKDWTKRNDHRHHAMDALAVAFTSPEHIQYLNNLHAKSHKGNPIVGIEKKLTYIDGKHKRRFIPPINNFREEAKKHLASILVSRKAKNKVATSNINKVKSKKGIQKQKTLTPRGQLHEETIYGLAHQWTQKNEKVNASFNETKINTVANQAIKQALLSRLHEHDNNPKKAFTGKNSLEKTPLVIGTKTWSDKVKTSTLEKVYTIKKDVTPDLKIGKVVDKGIQKILKKRLELYDGNPKEAFSNLEENPIWLNEAQGIAIKKVTITGIANAEVIHEKKDHLGNYILDKNGNRIKSSYIRTGNNHHVAVYKDAKGKLQEKVVAFFEAMARVLSDLPIIDKEYKTEEGWTYLFNLKQNEYFIFPTADFSPSKEELLDEKMRHLISPHLYRVQKISTKNYLFTHHLETKAIGGEDLKNRKVLANNLFYSIRSSENLRGIIKVRLDHIGNIIHVGDY